MNRTRKPSSGPADAGERLVTGLHRCRLPLPEYDGGDPDGRPLLLLRCLEKEQAEAALERLCDSQVAAWIWEERGAIFIGLLAAGQETVDSFLRRLTGVVDRLNQNRSGPAVLEIMDSRLLLPQAARAPRVVRLAPSLYVSHDPEAAAQVPGAHLVLNQGTVFGSGLHPSTRLAARLLAGMAAQGGYPATALDIGTGSGILAMACARFGSREVVALDVSPEAVAVAGENVRGNGLQDRVRVSSQPVASLAGDFELIVANLSCAALQVVRLELVRLLATGGRLVLSGLRGGQMERFCQGLASHGLDPLQVVAEGGWRAALLARRGGKQA